jgi:hypothetical protein
MLVREDCLKNRGADFLLEAGCFRPIPADEIASLIGSFRLIPVIQVLCGIVSRPKLVTQDYRKRSITFKVRALRGFFAQRPVDCRVGHAGA